MTQELHRPAGRPGPDGSTVRIEPSREPADLGGAGWRWVEFAAHTLADGATVRRGADDREVALIVLEGTVDVRAGTQTFGRIGSRSSVFDPAAPPVVLLTPGEDLEVTARGAAAIAIGAARGGDPHPSRLIEADAIRVETRGAGQTERTVRHLLAPDAAAGRLILFEVLTPAGNWSSYPPHKHDTEDQPRESQLEELYYYRFARPEGFAFTRVYTADRSLDAAMTPADGDDCYYLNVMAGPTRLWHFTVDPDHVWLMDWDPTVPRKGSR